VSRPVREVKEKMCSPSPTSSFLGSFVRDRKGFDDLGRRGRSEFINVFFDLPPKFISV